MPKAGRFHEGTPCWVELVVPDPEGARRFYRELFSWEFVETGDGSAVATLRGAAVAAVQRQRPGDPGGGAWRTYLAVDDADRVARLVREAGGQLAAEPFDVPDQGRSAGAVDPLGAAFGLWQGGPHPGAALVNEPGTFTWNEHLSAAPDTARAFYQRVFGYTFDPVPTAPDDYTLIRVGDLPAGGIGERPGVFPDEPAAFWATYFGVAETERTVERLLGLGGEVLAAPQPTPFGTLAVVRDDAGAAFSLIEVPVPA